MLVGSLCIFARCNAPFFRCDLPYAPMRARTHKGNPKKRWPKYASAVNGSSLRSRRHSWIIPCASALAGSSFGNWKAFKERTLAFLSRDERAGRPRYARSHDYGNLALARRLERQPWAFFGLRTFKNDHGQGRRRGSRKQARPLRWPELVVNPEPAGRTRRIYRTQRCCRCHRTGSRSVPRALALGRHRNAAPDCSRNTSARRL